MLVRVTSPAPEPQSMARRIPTDGRQSGEPPKSVPVEAEDRRRVIRVLEQRVQRTSTGLGSHNDVARSPRAGGLLSPPASG